MRSESAGSSSSSRARRRMVASATLHGKVLGDRYLIEDTLGTGGMGTVYAARDLHSGGRIAIKSLHAHASSTSNMRRLHREGTATAGCRSEHVCRVHHLGVEQGTPFIVMELLVGDTVATRLRRDGPLSAADAISIALQMLDGLQAMHDIGVLHRDVKPSNVFITSPAGEPPQVKIIDFGLARPLANTSLPSVGEDEDTAITTTDVIPGTPQYLTPEQLMGERDLDVRVDVWATALTVIEMLTGRRAYAGKGGNFELIDKILNAMPPSVTALRSDVPPTLDAVLARALEKDRAKRFESAAVFRTTLLDVWARWRAEAIARGAVMRSKTFRPQEP